MNWKLIILDIVRFLGVGKFIVLCVLINDFKVKFEICVKVE